MRKYKSRPRKSSLNLEDFNMEQNSIINFNEPLVPRYPKIQTKLVYAFKDGRPLTLDLITPPLLPNVKAHFPLLIYVPDVDEHNMVKSDERFAQMLEISKRGYAVALISYRTNSDVTAMVKDIHSATRFLLDHAFKYELDPYRYLLFGEGLGGYLSSLSILEQGQQRSNDEDVRRSPLRYKGGVLLETSLTPQPFSGPFLSELLLQNTQKLPPLLILNGTADNTLTDKQATELLSTIQSRGSEVSLFNFEGATLSSDAFFTPYSLDFLFEFIKHSFTKK